MLNTRHYLSVPLFSGGKNSLAKQLFLYMIDSSAKHLNRCVSVMKTHHHHAPKSGHAGSSRSGFLPRIDPNSRGAGRNSSAIPRSLSYVDPSRPVTLELSHGSDKQVISLPTERLDRNKRYYVTFTIKGGPNGSKEDKEAESSERRADVRHRHSESLWGSNRLWKGCQLWSVLCNVREYSCGVLLCIRNISPRGSVWVHHSVLSRFSSVISENSEYYTSISFDILSNLFFKNYPSLWSHITQTFKKNS